MERNPLPLNRDIALKVLDKAAEAGKLAPSVVDNLRSRTSGQVYLQDVPALIEIAKANAALPEVDFLTGNTQRVPGISDFLGYKMDAGVAQVYTGIQLLFGSGANGDQLGKVSDYTIQADHDNVGAVLQASTLEVWQENTLKEKIAIADMLDYDVTKEEAGGEGNDTAYGFGYAKSASSRVFWLTEYGTLSGDKKLQFKIVPPEDVNIPALANNLYRYFKLRFIGKHFTK